MSKIIVVSNDEEALAAFTNEARMLEWADEHGFEMAGDGDFILEPIPHSQNTGNLTISYGCMFYN